MTEILNQVLPILVLIVVGFGMRQVGFIGENTVADLRKIVVNLALPAVLFIAFLDVELEAEDSLLVAAVFALGVGLFIVGKLLHRRVQRQHEYFPFLMTGFEAGMLGISLFGTAYGLDRVGFFAVVDLGHELFIWFVFLALLLMKRDGISSFSSLAAAFFRSPVIMGILLGLGGNLLGIRDEMYEWPVTGGVLNTLVFLSALTVPLILLIVGYGIRLDRQGVREATVPVLTRFAIILPVAIVLPPLLVGDVLDGGEYAQAALFTLLILPPPFIIPLYMKEGIQDERRYVNNVLSLYTLLSVGAFIVYLGVNPL